jgi:biopolymer transport protein ExbB
MQSWLAAWFALALASGGCVFDRSGVTASALGDGTAPIDAPLSRDAAQDLAPPGDAQPLSDGPTTPDRMKPDRAPGDGPICSAWDPAWTKRSKLTFNNLFSNVALNDQLDDFPVLIKLTKARLATLSLQPNGGDLRFVDADDKTVLPFEVETWNPSGTSYVWVKVPRVDQASTQDHIWLYHGNPAAPLPPATSTQVWSSSFRAVYHLQQDPAAAAPQFLDSTGNANNATTIGSNVSQASGRIGGAVDLPGLGQSFLEAPDSTSLDITKAVTLEGWVWLAHINQDAGRYLVKKNTAYFLHVLRTYTDRPAAYVHLSPSLGWFAQSAPVLKAKTWSYVVGTYDTADRLLRIYVDGELVKSRDLSNASVPVSHTITASNEALSLGRSVDGVIDEVRVSATRRSDGWIAAQHRSMTDAFVTFGAATPSCP